MSGHNRFEKLAEKTSEAFHGLSDMVARHKSSIMTATYCAAYVGLLAYQPEGHASPVLEMAHEAATLAHEATDRLDEAGGTEYAKTLVDYAVNGYLTPLFTTPAGLRMLASTPWQALVGVKDQMFDDCKAAKAFVARGLEHFQWNEKKSGHTNYFVADTVADGVAGVFTDGPRDEFDSRWMGGEGIGFEVAPGREPVVAVGDMMALSDLMSEQMYCKLLSAQQELTHASADGRKLSHNLAAAIESLDAVVQVAPWRLDLGKDADRAAAVDNDHAPGA